MTDHSKCSNAYKQVTCDRCGRTYTCTPSADLYCMPKGDHCCETCLCIDMRVSKITTVTPDDLTSPV